MEPLIRQEVREVLAEYGVQRAWRAPPVDPTEEIFLLSPEDYRRIDVTGLGNELRQVIVGKKLSVIQWLDGWPAEEV